MITSPIILEQELIVCHAPAYPDPHKPTPNTFANALRFSNQHGGKVKSRYSSAWDDLAPDQERDYRSIVIIPALQVLNDIPYETVAQADLVIRASDVLKDWNPTQRSLHRLAWDAAERKEDHLA